MSSEGSVTAWLPRFKEGDPAAEEWLVGSYFERVASLARKQLGLAPRRDADEEDVANSVFKIFLERAKNGGFKQLHNRDDLHRILLMLTKRRAIDYFRRTTRRTRLEVGESAVAWNGTADSAIPFDQIARVEAPRDLVAEISDEIRELFHDIECEELHLDKIAMWRLEGYSVSEIASRLECLPRTVYRRLKLIQKRWLVRAELEDSSAEER